MAKRTSTKKTPSKGKRSKSKITATADAIIISLNQAQKKQAKDCIRRSGSVTFTIEEIQLDDMLGFATAEVITD